eukprot:CAMPEP_0171485126 /NCGR_PEP_ID=MMETSP0958-20121227/374_1 /TAXON_ID=87120 /ORGANISM="Aurantiochytrium limacinum, Strain ATCCMYA-1381" /LENGTH=57 /DNA_ID=CAMNT_0012017885 /DNA_START=83 /DNA_END=256 /DNA_ORIENTATION=+
MMIDDDHETLAEAVDCVVFSPCAALEALFDESLDPRYVRPGEQAASTWGDVQYLERS